MPTADIAAVVAVITGVGVLSYWRLLARWRRPRAAVGGGSQPGFAEA
jgi:hypothetical protein